MEELEVTIMNIIVHAGSARSFAMEAISEAKAGHFEESQKYIESAAEEMLLAHHTQTDLIQNEANGNHTQVSLLLVHAQDHLMTSIVVIDLAKEFVDLYRQMKA